MLNPYDYEAYTTTIEAARSNSPDTSDNSQLRMMREEFRRHLLLKEEDWMLWIDDELERNPNDTFYLDSLFQEALNDCYSPKIALNYLKFIKESETHLEGFKKYLFFYAWDYDHGGRELLALYETAVEGGGSSHVSQENFKLFASFFHFDNQESSLTNAIDSVLSKSISSSDKIVVCRAIFERAISINYTDFHLWLQYLAFLRTRFNVSNVVISITGRLVKAFPLELRSWQEHLEALEAAGDSSALQNLWLHRLPRKQLLFTSLETFISLQMTYLDALRRLGYRETTAISSNLENEFKEALFLQDKHFANLKTGFADPQERLARYYTNLLLKSGRKGDFQNIWQNQLLKKHAREAAFWLEYIQGERKSADGAISTDEKDLSCYNSISNAFKRACAAVSDYPETIFYEWITWERQNGPTLAGLFEARERIERQRKLISERKRTQNEKQQEREQHQTHSSKKRPMKESIQEQPILKASKSEIPHAFDPSATLFVNNLPFEMTEEAISAHFQSLLCESRNESETDASRSDSDKDASGTFVKSIRMHQKKTKTTASFKGHATVEFDSPQTAEAILNRYKKHFLNNRPIFLAKYMSPVLNDGNGDREPPQEQQRVESDRRTLFISSLPAELTDSSLHEQLEQASINFSKIRRPPGRPFAYVEFESEAEAHNHLKKLNSMKLKGSNDSSPFRLRAAFSNPPSREVSKPEESKSDGLKLLHPRSVSLKSNK